MKTPLIVLLSVALAASLARHWTHQEKAPPPQPTVVVPPPAIPVPSRYEVLAEDIRRAHASDGLKGCGLGFCLLGPTGEMLVDVNAQTAFIPASTLKTVTTATALQRLGPEYTFHTKVLATAPNVAGRIAGDLIILGGGDPMLTLANIDQWAAELHRQGLTEIQGNILGDGRLFTGSLYDDFWNWGDIGNGYGSAVCGLNLQHNRFTVTLRAGDALGAPASIISTVPGLPGITLLNEVTTGPATTGDAVVIYGGERTTTISLRGTVPLGAEATAVLGAIPDPEAFTAQAFRTALIRQGIAVAGTSASIRTTAPSGALQEAPLLLHASPPLLEIITSIHATSDNQETECLFRKLGLAARQDPAELIREHWKAAGLDFVALRMEDGCGLARANHIRPLDLAKLQFLALHGPHGSAYAASLLSEKSLRWKGGAMSSIRSTTGYLTDTKQQVYSFALMFNHYSDKAAVHALRTEIVETVAAW